MLAYTVSLTSPLVSRTARLLRSSRLQLRNPSTPSTFRGPSRSLRTVLSAPIFSPGMNPNGLSTAAGSTAAMSSSDPGRGVAGSGEVGPFELSPSSILKIQKGDITTWSVNRTNDAIVNAANQRMLGGGGVDGAIHRAAGPELRAACSKVPEVQPGVRCPTGEARITQGFKLPVAYVIHTVGPIYDADDQPEVSLRNSYRNSLRLAKENGIRCIAFPAISCGVFGYPYKEASTIAISTVKEFANDFKEVHFVLFSDEIYNTWIESASKLL